MKNKLLTLAFLSVVLQSLVNHAAHAEREQQNKNMTNECKAGMDSSHCQAISNLDDMQKKAGDMKSMMENCMHCMTPKMMNQMSDTMKIMNMMIGQMHADQNHETNLQNQFLMPNLLKITVHII